MKLIKPNKKQIEKLLNRNHINIRKYLDINSCFHKNDVFLNKKYLDHTKDLFNFTYIGVTDKLFEDSCKEIENIQKK